MPVQLAHGFCVLHHQRFSPIYTELSNGCKKQETAADPRKRRQAGKTCNKSAHFVPQNGSVCATYNTFVTCQIKHTLKLVKLANANGILLESMYCERERPMGSLREFRESRGIKQIAVANYVGVSRQTYARYEEHPESMNLKQAKLVCDFLGCDIAFLLPNEVKKTDVRG